MKIRIPLVLAVATILAAGATPVAAADKEQRQMMADLRILQEQSQQIQNLLNALNESLKAVNARIDEQTGATRKALADQKLVIDALTNDVRIVREKVDDNNVRVGSLTQELDALRQSVTALSASRTPIEVDPAGAGADASAAAAAPPAAAAVGASPQRLFDGARADYWAGQYDLAVVGFESYLKTFPQSPQADEAQLYVGHSHMQAGKYEKAIEGYDAAIRSYPKSKVLPEAYLKKGIALKTLKENDKAREAFEYVMKNYPDTTEATMAQQQQQQLLARKP